MEFIRYSCGGQAEDIGVLKQKDLISQIE